MKNDEGQSRGRPTARNEIASRQRLKILFFHNAVAEYRVDFVNALADIAHLTMVIHDQGITERVYDWNPGTANLKGVRIVRGGYSPAFVCRVVGLERPDVVILPAPDTLGDILIGMSAALAARRHAVPRLAIFWEYWTAPSRNQDCSRRIKNLLKRVGTAPILPLIDVFLSPGKKSHEYWLSRGVPEGKIAEIGNERSAPLPVPWRRGSFEAGDATEGTIVFAGRLVPRKGVHLLVEALSSLRLERRMRFIVAGDGPERTRLETQCANSLRMPCEFAGRLQPGEVFQLFQEAAVVVVPSYFLRGEIEPWGFVVNEALLAGVPVVATTAVGAAWDLLDGRNGIMVPAGEVEPLRDAIVAALRLPRSNFQPGGPSSMAQRLVDAVSTG